MQSELCQRHFKGNGYGFDGPWKADSQKISATQEALFLFYEWIEGREKTPTYRDAILGIVEIYGDSVRQACRLLYAASLDRVCEKEAMKMAYFDEGIEKLTHYFRRHPGLFNITTR